VDEAGDCQTWFVEFPTLQLIVWKGLAMTTTVSRHAELIESSEDETRRAVQSALVQVGMTYDQLADQARRGEFSNMTARMAWVAVRDLRDFAD
jgi:hypothetical protein